MPSSTSIGVPSMMSCFGIAHSAACFSAAWCRSMRASITPRKWRSSPCTGQAAPSPNAQMVWPSILRGHVLQQIDLALCRPRRAPCGAACATSSRTLPTGRALTAALVLVEVGDAADGGDDIGRLIHHDHGRRAHPRLELGQGVEIERQVLADVGRQAAASTSRRG
mgnify:CR=1 FL=1